MSADQKIELRAPEELMRLARLGSFHQTRLSFMRALLRRLKRENWRFERPVWNINAQGEGLAVYTAKGPRRTYSLVAFARDLPSEQRSDRVIATAWDATFCLHDGVPSRSDLDRLQANVPLQEAGRISDKELSLSRANRSVRLWAYVVDQLAAGQQPDRAEVEAVGYLMRTTAVYGSGKFGAADRCSIQDRTMAGGAFRIEMLSVYLTRAFTLDLVEHMAKVKGGQQAALLEPGLRRRFGVGNSTGLGMAPFLINHPALLDRWIVARETALARVRALPEVSKTDYACFLQHLKRASLDAAHWHSAHALQTEKIGLLREDLKKLAEHLDQTAMIDTDQAWNVLFIWAQAHLSLEGQELLVSLLLEPYGALVDDLAAEMKVDENAVFRIDGSEPIGEFKAYLQQHYAWALAEDFSQQLASSWFWYISEEKLEPRLGERDQEDGAALELPLCTGRDIQSLYQAMSSWSDDGILADFLLAQPEHRHSVRRAQINRKYPYSEIQDNLIGQQMLPIDLLRCKLSFFGATRFDPRSDRWVRICMFQNAPFPKELASLPADDWAYPPLSIHESG